MEMHKWAEGTVLIFTVMVLCDFHGPEALRELQGLKDQAQCISLSGRHRRQLNCLLSYLTV